MTRKAALTGTGLVFMLLSCGPSYVCGGSEPKRLYTIAHLRAVCEDLRHGSSGTRSNNIPNGTVDAWGNSLVTKDRAGHLQVSSAGEDGQFDTADDLTEVCDAE